MCSRFSIHVSNAITGEYLAELSIATGSNVAAVLEELARVRSLPARDFKLLFKGSILMPEWGVQRAGLFDGCLVQAFATMPDRSGSYSAIVDLNTEVELRLFQGGVAIIEEKCGPEDISAFCSGEAIFDHLLGVKGWQRVRVGMWRHMYFSRQEQGVKIKWLFEREAPQGLPARSRRRTIEAVCHLRVADVVKGALAFTEYPSVLSDTKLLPSLLTVDEHNLSLEDLAPADPGIGFMLGCPSQAAGLCGVEAPEGWRRSLQAELVSAEESGWAFSADEGPLREERGKDEETGISLSYLLRFRDIAADVSGLETPTFNQLKLSFWEPKVIVHVQDSDTEFSLDPSCFKDEDAHSGLVNSQKVKLLSEESEVGVGDEERFAYMRMPTGRPMTLHASLSDALTGQGPLDCRKVARLQPLGFNSTYKTYCRNDGKLGSSITDSLLESDFTAVGSANLFVSWTWRYSVKTLSSALANFARKEGLDADKTFLWICFFQNNQHRLIEKADIKGPKVLGKEFADRLVSIGRMAIVLDTWNQPAYCSRVWTLFETFHSVRSSVPAKVAFPDVAGGVAVVGTQEQTLDMIVEDICDGINVEEAKATYESDQEDILALIKEHGGGFSNFNRIVRTKVWDAFMDLVRDAQRSRAIEGSGALEECKQIDQERFWKAITWAAAMDADMYKVFQRFRRCARKQRSPQHTP